MSSQRAKAHARHAYFCSCGKIVHGNGAKAQHKAMHQRDLDGHRWVTSQHYGELFPDYQGGGSDRRVQGGRHQPAAEALPR